MRVNLVGEKFNRLEVIREDENNKNKWLCKCCCGSDKLVSVNTANLRRGHTKSCGCLHEEWLTNYNTTHGLTKNKFYETWKNIKYRCLNRKASHYYLYGGRGISIYKAWLDEPNEFIKYVESLENATTEGYSIDRIDTNGNYEPGNLKWSTDDEQARNKRNNKLTVEKVRELKRLYKNGEKTIKELSLIYDLTTQYLSDVIKGKYWKGVE